jgi:hypothetical protein
MVKALVLYTNGEYAEVNLKGFEDYQKYVEGNIESLPIDRGYVNPNKTTTKQRLSCYANEEGMIRQLPSNPWAGFLSVLGVKLFSNIFIFGNVLVLSANDRSIDPYIVNLAKEFTDCEDEDDFYVSLEKINEKKSSKTSNEKTDVSDKSEKKEEEKKKTKSDKPKRLTEKEEPKITISDDTGTIHLNKNNKKQKRNSKTGNDVTKKQKKSM